MKPHPYTKQLRDFYSKESNLGVTWDEEEGTSHYPDGSYAVNCTSGARQVCCRFPDGVGKIFGWADGTNGGAIDKKHHGHDFAILYDRWLVDVWMRHVTWVDPDTEKRARAVYDLEYPPDAKRVAMLYGDRSTWEELDTGTRGDTDALPPGVPPQLPAGDPWASRRAA